MMQLLPFEFARKQYLIFEPEHNLIHLTDDTSPAALLEWQRAYRIAPSVNYLDTEAFEAKLQSLYAGYQGSSATVMENIRDDADLKAIAVSLEEAGDLLDQGDDAPIIRLLNAILAEALNEKASDIHIEPYRHEAKVRFRLDGALRTVLAPAAHITPLLISRIKVMAKLDISEKRLPQDGRMAVKLGGRSIDLRVSTMPSTYGERVVLRLLDKSATKLEIEDLGMTQTQRHGLKSMIARPHGMILVTGPTGSGKTTTLYAALLEMDRKTRNIMTVEDPVEYDLEGISQTQINLRSGMTFAKGLKAILRQDPDVVLIGEIRDRETAEIAVQASLTGHLVLSTLHTNTAVGAVARMQDLGIESFLLASTLRGVLAQRLVRKLCRHCRQAVPADAVLSKLPHSPRQIYRAVGCDECNGTGYLGRTSLFEMMAVTDELQRLIHNRADEAELECAVRKVTPGIRDEGYRLVAEGVTSLEEVIRVTTE